LTPGLAKFDPQGLQLWSHTFPSASGAYVNQVSIDAQGRIAIKGTVSGTANVGLSKDGEGRAAAPGAPRYIRAGPR
jgi:hypothetical protein